MSANQATSSSEITSILKEKHSGLEVSSRTVRRTLSSLRYIVCQPQRVPLLSPQHIAKRREWARKYSRHNWKQTIFTDESTFQMFRNTQLVRYKAGNPRPQRAMVKHPYKVHVWGAFSARGPIGFHMFTGMMNAKVYCQILESHLLPN